MLSLADISDQTADYAEQMLSLSDEAQRFLRGHRWCRKVDEGFLTWCFPYLAVFRFDVQVYEASEKLWVIVGDVPPAYLDVTLCPNAKEAIEGYLGELMAWVEAATEGSAVDGLMPVYRRYSFEVLDATPEVARSLRKRIEFIERNILLPYSEELRSNRYVRTESHTL